MNKLTLIYNQQNEKYQKIKQKVHFFTNLIHL